VTAVEDPATKDVALGALQSRIPEMGIRAGPKTGRKPAVNAKLLANDQRRNAACIAAPPAGIVWLAALVVCARTTDFVRPFAAPCS